MGCLEIEESDVAVIPLFDGSRNGWSHIPSGLFVAGRGGSQAFALYSESAPTPDCAKGWGASYIELNEPYRNTFHRDDLRHRFITRDVDYTFSTSVLDARSEVAFGLDREFSQSDGDASDARERLGAPFDRPRHFLSTHTGRTNYVQIREWNRRRVRFQLADKKKGGTFYDAAANAETGRVVTAGGEAGVVAFRPGGGAARGRQSTLEGTSLVTRADCIMPCPSDVISVAPDALGEGASTHEVVAAGMRDGCITVVDSRSASHVSRFGQMSTYVTFVTALKTHPWHLIAASAHGNLARFDLRNSSAPVMRYDVPGDVECVFDPRRKPGLDPTESFVAMGVSRRLETLALWDVSGRDQKGSRDEEIVSPLWEWSSNSNWPVMWSQESFCAVTVETAPAPRVWAGGPSELWAFAPEPLLGNNPSLTRTGFYA